jgi:hypothetical protein
LINLTGFKRFLLNFPLGLFLGAVFTLLLAWKLESLASQAIERNYVSLFAACAGLIAAVLALAGALTNVANQNELSEKQRIARLRASQAVLPLALARIHNVTTLGILLAAEAEELRKNPAEARARLNTLGISDNDIKTIKDCIEVADPASAAWLGLIMAHFQIELSRLETRLFDPAMIVMPGQTANSVADWCLIRGFTEQLFNFSRTGAAASGVLAKDKLTFPLDVAGLGFHLEEQIQTTITKTVQYFDEKGGWGIEAFKARLHYGVVE